jgi:predicted Zn-dependent peptidase
LELISDIVFNSIFPFKELEKEKEVVIDEINSYQDSPSELIFDDFEDQMFNGYPIGRNILGSPELVKSFNKEKIIKFMDKAYNTDEMVISSVGNISFAKLVRIVEKYFAHIPANPRSFTRIIPVDYAVSNNVVERNTYQSHCIMGNLAYSATDEKRITLGMLTNILGGPGLNSRLNLNLREKHGLAYNVEANYSPYADKGIFNIYFGCDHEDLNKCFSICNKEMKKLKDKKLGILQFRTAQQQLLGQMAISSENNENQMLSIGKSIILYDRVDTLESIYKKIAHVSANDLLEVANEIFEPSTMSTLIYK